MRPEVGVNNNDDSRRKVNRSLIMGIPVGTAQARLETAMRHMSRRASVLVMVTALVLVSTGSRVRRDHLADGQPVRRSR